MLNHLFGVFSNDLTIDLSNANILIDMRGKGIVLNEPSMVAIRQERSGDARSIEAVGMNAKRILCRTPENITAIRS